MTTQERMKNKLYEAGIPAKEIKVYGSQIMITCKGRKSAERFNALLHTICRKVVMAQGIDDVQSKPNAKMEYRKVWRVWGTI